MSRSPEPSRLKKFKKSETPEASNLPHILGIAQDRMSVIRDDDQIMAVTNWLHNGVEVDPDEATALVAGPSPEGHWYTIDLRAFDFESPRN